MNGTVSSFLSSHNFVNHIDVLSVAHAILNDMQQGLKTHNAYQDMILTFCNPPKESAKNKSVIVIDAGGTNFRSCLVTFDSNGKPTISDMQKTKMPGVEKELSKKEFFDAFANNLEHLRNKADRIGFCFSYPMKIQKDGDGILIGFSKEVKAPEVVGCEIGKCLKQALIEHGWNSIKKVALCNDTVAALLAGAACAPSIENYSSYIGFILGTGMNAAYIQPEDNSLNIKQQIVVCESGKFNGVNRSDFDIDFGKTTAKPNEFYLEKLCSGAYLGSLSLYALKAASKENLFSAEVSKQILELNDLTLIQVGNFLTNPYDTENIIGSILSKNGSVQDYDNIYQITDAIVERSARYSAAILIACAIQSNGGKIASKPISILCNGSTFYKTERLSMRVSAYLDQILTNQLGIYWKIVSCDDDITLGAAISGLID